MTRALLLVASSIFLFCGLFGCNDEGDNFIDGSLVKNYHISYDSVRARLYSTELSIEYLSDSVEGVPALMVTLHADNAVLAEGKTYDLVKYGSVTRYSELGSLPELQSGELTLDTYSNKDGATVAGTFHAVFVTEAGVTLGLRGAFKAPLELVAL